MNIMKWSKNHAILSSILIFITSLNVVIAAEITSMATQPSAVTRPTHEQAQTQEAEISMGVQDAGSAEVDIEQQNIDAAPSDSFRTPAPYNH